MKEVCQNCKKFTNNPGWCKLKKEYIARKHEACTEFKGKKT
jgi:hypothetical protein